jgi:hypothetical protein
MRQPDFSYWVEGEALRIDRRKTFNHHFSSPIVNMRFALNLVVHLTGTDRALLD